MPTLAPDVLAQSMFSMLVESGVTSQNLGVLAHLVARGDVGVGQPVATGKTQDNGFVEQPLVQALVGFHRAGRYSPGFFREDTARALLALDPDCFSWERRSGGWWMWHILGEWQALSDRERYGVGRCGDTDFDDWAAVAIESLPHEAFGKRTAACNGWDACLVLGLDRAAQAIERKQPGKWLDRDPDGALLLKRARSSDTWQAVLDSGVDPLAVAPGARRYDPLWRELLPARSGVPPEPGSFRDGIETWMTQCIAQGHPQASDMLGYKAAWLARWLGPSGEYDAKETDSAWRDRLAHMARQPDAWLGVATPHPGWAAPFFNRTKGRAARWAKALGENPQWRAHAGPLGEVVLALFGQPDPNQVAPDTWRALAQHDPAGGYSAHWLRQMLEAKVWGPKGPRAEALLAVMEAYRLDAVMAPAARRPGAKARM